MSIRTETPHVTLVNQKESLLGGQEVCCELIFCQLGAFASQTVAILTVDGNYSHPISSCLMRIKRATPYSGFSDFLICKNLWTLSQVNRIKCAIMKK